MTTRGCARLRICSRHPRLQGVVRDCPSRDCVSRACASRVRTSRGGASRCTTWGNRGLALIGAPSRPLRFRANIATSLFPFFTLTAASCHIFCPVRCCKGLRNDDNHGVAARVRVRLEHHLELAAIAALDG
jgi:hypothetical protein